MGVAIKHLGYAHAFALFSTIGLFAATLSPLYPRHLDQEEDAHDPAGIEETTQPAVEENHTE
ncbi:MAG TPA: hypothetical protein VK973_06650 [Arenicellales bacterium]|nr:hypothetical protein [Arenicellales bacterium]